MGGCGYSERERDLFDVTVLANRGMSEAPYFLHRELGDRGEVLFQAAPGNRAFADGYAQFKVDYSDRVGGVVALVRAEGIERHGWTPGDGRSGVDRESGLGAIGDGNRR